MTDPARSYPSGSGPVLDERAAAAPAGEAQCACGHSSESHDRVAVRYCAATSAGHIRRGCLCQALTDPSPRY